MTEWYGVFLWLLGLAIGVWIGWAVWRRPHLEY